MQPVLQKQDLLDFASHSVISKVTPGSTLGHTRGQWILTSFTHGCRQMQQHKGGLPVVFSNTSTLADRTLSRCKMNDGGSLTLDRQQSHLSVPLPVHDKGALPAVQRSSSPLVLTGSDISIDPRSHTSCKSKLLSVLAIQTLVFSYCNRLPADCSRWMWSDRQTACQEIMSLVSCVVSLWHQGESDMWPGLGSQQGGPGCQRCCSSGGLQTTGSVLQSCFTRKSITYYITSHFFSLRSRVEEAELKMCLGWLCCRKV